MATQFVLVQVRRTDQKMVVRKPGFRLFKSTKVLERSVFLPEPLCKLGKLSPRRVKDVAGSLVGVAACRQGDEPVRTRQTDLDG